MSMTVACALVLVGIVATCFCEPIDFKTCDGAPDTIEKVLISPCPSQPCTFKHNMTATVQVFFKSVKASTNLTAEIFGIIAGIPVKFNMPDPNGCARNITCPIKEQEIYEYSGTFSVLPTYPIIRLVVRWDLLSDDKSYQFCFNFPVVIAS